MAAPLQHSSKPACATTERPTMKPKSLDCPPRYTRAQREQADDAGYACSISIVKRKMDWQDKVVVVGSAAAAVAILVIMVWGLAA